MQVSGSSNSSLDLSPTGLFPDKEGAENDKKCSVISKIFMEIESGIISSSMTQEQLRVGASEHYAFLSREPRLTLPTADHAAFQMSRRGISPMVAQEYYALRLSEEDAKKWQIVVIG